MPVEIRDLDGNLLHTYPGDSLIGADLRSINLDGASLDGARLDGARLDGARLDGARLVGASLDGARLVGASLVGASLDGARLDGARLDGARLDGARLDGARLDGASGIDPRRCVPLLILLDQIGPVRGYKLVDGHYRSPIQSAGKLTYTIGTEVSVNEWNEDANVSCGTGVNVATLSWCMREWKIGYRILLVEWDKADWVCIPTATDGKMRVKRIRVLSEVDLTELGLVPAVTAEVA